MEFKATKCWLKSFDSNKVIIEVVQEVSWLELLNPWL